jgi:hypothetical protein
MKPIMSQWSARRGALYAVASSSPFAERNVNLTVSAGPPAQPYETLPGGFRESNQPVMRVTWEGLVTLRKMTEEGLPGLR